MTADLNGNIDYNISCYLVNHLPLLIADKTNP